MSVQLFKCHMIIRTESHYLINTADGRLQNAMKWMKINQIQVSIFQNVSCEREKGNIKQNEKLGVLGEVVSYNMRGLDMFTDWEGPT